MNTDHFLRLPVELRQEILSSISDVESLWSAVTSCRTLLAALLGSQHAIVSRVLHNEFDRPFRREALIALASSPSSIKREESISKFCADYLCPASQSDPDITLPDALELARIHRNVLYFSPKLIAHAIEKAPGDDFGAISPTKSEISRFERSIFLYDIFANLLRARVTSKDIPEGRVQRKKLYKAFFTRFAPWEMEQLACVDNFLINLTISAFNNFAEHDVRDSFLSNREVLDDARRLVEPILNHDIGYIRRMDECNDPSTWPEFSNFFRTDSKEHPPRVHIMGSSLMTFKHYAPNGTEESETAYDAGFFDDNDVGPQEIWRWAESGSFLGLINDPQQNSLRRWCYVMWDDARFNRIGIMEERWRHLEPDNDTEDELAKKASICVTQST